MAKKQKLELTWIGKNEQPRLEPRILIEDKEKSYGDPNTENMLIHGDNLLALKALEQEYAGKVKCIFIDPPYNTGVAFDQYDDGLEHSIWLSLLRDRILLLWRLLNNDGSLWITIDDNECHYLKVLCDEYLGRSNFVTSFAWEKDKGRRSDTAISSAHDHILLYAKNKENWKNLRNTLSRTPEQESRYRNPDKDPRGVWLQGDNSTAKSGTENSRFPITTPSGKVVQPSSGRYWAFSVETYETALKENRVYFGKKGSGMPIIKRYLTDVQSGVVPRTWWPADEAGHNQEAKRDHLNKLLKDVPVFATPKPEKLLQRIIHISTVTGELILDSFLGSGTTTAVAHKMGRRWIGIELGDHAYTHCQPRLKQVVDGTDQGGISKAVEWKGGGGFKFYELAPSLLKEDKYGNWVIAPDYNADMMAAAMAKHEGFQYNPDQEVFWKQGQSTEKDFIFTTTQFVTVEMVEQIHEDMKPDESLLIACKAYHKEAGKRYPNITVKKIPNLLLGRCEFGKDDYSLNIIDMPRDPDEPAFVPPGPPPEKPNKKKETGMGDLFDAARVEEG
ncbi:site-specific DNA-methyltransferase [bacterium]|nr:site-specific DNA-methyltransferase [bacterium]